jgi:hypothetical protein
MESYPFNQFTHQLQEISSTIKKHLGKNIYTIHTIGYILILYDIFSFSDDCECNSNDFPDNDDNLLRMYTNFIDHNLLPEMQYLSNKYNIWWTFKQNSSLNNYLEKQGYSMNKYFYPEELVNVLKDIFRTNNLEEVGNEQLIILDNDLQILFNSWILHLPNLTNYCLAHVEMAPYDISLKLQNKHMALDYYVKSPMSIIYNDPTSQFCLHPIVNFMMNKNKQVTFNWNELLDLFINFCTNNLTLFTPFNDSFYGVNANSPLRFIFKFKYFHISQCEEILKSLTKFLGRTNSLKDVCKYLHFNNYFISTDGNVLTFIDDVINNNHNISPQFHYNIHL